MPANYSIDGFSLRLADGIIELRAEGDHGTGSSAAREPANAFTAIAPHLASRNVLYDVRNARYDFSDLEWEELLRHTARILKGYRTAYVVRSDQVPTANRLLAAHARLGDEAACFRTTAEARDWLTAG